MIHITEEKLKAAIQICLAGDNIYTEEREAKLVHDIKALSIADVSGNSLDYILRELFTNVAFSLSELDFEKDYKTFFEKMNDELNDEYLQLQERFFNVFEAKFEDNFTPMEIYTENCKYSKKSKDNVAYVDGYNSAICEIKERVKKQKELVIDAIEQGFTLSNAVRSN